MPDIILVDCPNCKHVFSIQQKDKQHEIASYQVKVPRVERLDDEGPNETFDYVRDGRLPTSEQLETEE